MTYSYKLRSVLFGAFLVCLHCSPSTRNGFEIDYPALIQSSCGAQGVHETFDYVFVDDSHRANGLNDKNDGCICALSANRYDIFIGENKVCVFGVLNIMCEEVQPGCRLRGIALRQDYSDKFSVYHWSQLVGTVNHGQLEPEGAFTKRQGKDFELLLPKDINIAEPGRNGYLVLQGNEKFFFQGLSPEKVPAYASLGFSDEAILITSKWHNMAILFTNGTILASRSDSDLCDMVVDKGSNTARDILRTTHSQSPTIKHENGEWQYSFDHSIVCSFDKKSLKRFSTDGYALLLEGSNPIGALIKKQMYSTSSGALYSFSDYQHALLGFDNIFYTDGVSYYRGAEFESKEIAAGYDVFPFRDAILFRRECKAGVFNHALVLKWGDIKYLASESDNATCPITKMSTTRYTELEVAGIEKKAIVLSSLALVKADIDSKTNLKAIDLQKLKHAENSQFMLGSKCVAFSKSGKLTAGYGFKAENFGENSALSRKGLSHAIDGPLVLKTDTDFYGTSALWLRKLQRQFVILTEALLVSSACSSDEVAKSDYFLVTKDQRILEIRGRKACNSCRLNAIRNKILKVGSEKIFHNYEYGLDFNPTEAICQCHVRNATLDSIIPIQDDDVLQWDGIFLGPISDWKKHPIENSASSIYVPSSHVSNDVFESLNFVLHHDGQYFAKNVVVASSASCRLVQLPESTCFVTAELKLRGNCDEASAKFEIVPMSNPQYHQVLSANQPLAALKVENGSIEFYKLKEANFRCSAGLFKIDKKVLKTKTAGGKLSAAKGADKHYVCNDKAYSHDEASKIDRSMIVDDLLIESGTTLVADLKHSMIMHEHKIQALDENNLRVTAGSIAFGGIKIELGSAENAVFGSSKDMSFYATEHHLICRNGNRVFVSRLPTATKGATDSTEKSKLENDINAILHRIEISKDVNFESCFNVDTSMLSRFCSGQNSDNSPTVVELH